MYEELIQRVLSGEVVDLRCSNVGFFRDKLHKEILEQTPEPIEIITRPDFTGLIVKKFDRKLISLEDAEKVAKGEMESPWPT